MKESKYLEFRFAEQKPKTKVWEVISKQHGFRLGLIKYFGRWRQYAFWPEAGTIWNHECLKDVIEFLNYENGLRKV